MNRLYQTMRENFDMLDQGVVALQGNLEDAGHEVERMLSMAKKWGDLLAFLTKERLMYLCSKRSNIGVPAFLPTKKEISALKIKIFGDSSMKLRGSGKKGSTIARDLKEQWTALPARRCGVGASPPSPWTTSVGE